MMRNGLFALALVFVLLCLGCGHSRRHGAREPEFLTSEQTRELGLPFSDAVRVGRFLFLSGQIGNLPGTLELAPGGMAGQARQALENIRTLVERHGSSMENVVKCTVFLLDMGEWPAFNEVYVEFFPENAPARSALGASGLAVGAHVEVECMAVVSR